MQSCPRTLKIVMLTTVRFHLAKGGTEKVMIDTANALVDRGHEVTIIFRDKNGSSPGFTLNDNVKLVNCNLADSPFWYSNFACEVRAFSLSKSERAKKKAILNLKSVAFRYREALTSCPADVYITYDPKLSAMLVSEFHVQQPIVTTFQFDPEHIIKRYYFEAVKSLIGRAGPIQVLLPHFKNRILSVIPGSQCVVIPNAVPQIEKKANLDTPLILNIGRVMPLKNQELIARAMVIVHQKYPEWKAKIVGEADVNNKYTLKIQKILSDNNLNNVVFFAGASDNIADELLSSSIFVFPSISEGFGLALAEAMSAGLPCVGLKSCSAVSHLIQHGKNGLLTENTPESLADAIIRLIKDNELRLRLGQQAKEDMKKFSPSQIWDQWENLLYALKN